MSARERDNEEERKSAGCHPTMPASSSTRGHEAVEVNSQSFSQPTSTTDAAVKVAARPPRLLHVGEYQRPSAWRRAARVDPLTGTCQLQLKAGGRAYRQPFDVAEMAEDTKERKRGGASKEPNHVREDAREEDQEEELKLTPVKSIAKHTSPIGTDRPSLERVVAKTEGASDAVSTPPSTAATSTAASTPSRSQHRRTPRILPKNLRVLSPSERIHVLEDGKLTREDVAYYRRLVRDLGAVLSDEQQFANLVVCGARGPRRVEKYLEDNVRADEVPVLHVSWLDECADKLLMQPYDRFWVLPERRGAKVEEVGDGGASVEVKDEDVGKDDDHSNDAAAGRAFERSASQALSPSRQTPSLGKRVRPSTRSSSPERTDSAAGEDDGESFISDTAEKVESEVGPSGGAFYSDEHGCGAIPGYSNHAYACYRPSPLTCVNQRLCEELAVLREARELAGPSNRHQADSYARAISAIKAYPHDLAKDPQAARRLKGVGPKIARLIVQYYELGHIVEVEQIRHDKSFHAMTDMMQLYGVGPKRARDLYQQGARSLEDAVRMGHSIAHSIPLEETLRILPDLREKIPRREVEHLCDLIQAELDKILPGTVHTICGGYRRGKPMSNDVDIVFSPAPGTSHSAGETEGVLDRVLVSLKRKGLMTHAVKVAAPSADKYHETEPDLEVHTSHGRKRHRSKSPTARQARVAAERDERSPSPVGLPLPILGDERVDLAEIVFLPPRNEAVPRPRHRRLDLLFCREAEVYGAVVLGWTGSRQFERDIRRVAKEEGYKFHSTGLTTWTRQGDEVLVPTPREQDIFDTLGLPYMPPHLRNCDL